MHQARMQLDIIPSPQRLDDSRLGKDEIVTIE
jgi:hypothetical protein